MHVSIDLCPSMNLSFERRYPSPATHRHWTERVVRPVARCFSHRTNREVRYECDRQSSDSKRQSHVWTRTISLLSDNRKESHVEHRLSQPPSLARMFRRRALQRNRSNGHEEMNSSHFENRLAEKFISMEPNVLSENRRTGPQIKPVGCRSVKGLVEKARLTSEIRQSSYFEDGHSDRLFVIIFIGKSQLPLIVTLCHSETWRNSPSSVFGESIHLRSDRGSVVYLYWSCVSHQSIMTSTIYSSVISKYKVEGTPLLSRELIQSLSKTIARVIKVRIQLVYRFSVFLKPRLIRSGLKEHWNLSVVTPCQDSVGRFNEVNHHSYTVLPQWMANKWQPW